MEWSITDGCIRCRDVLSGWPYGSLGSVADWLTEELCPIAKFDGLAQEVVRRSSDHQVGLSVALVDLRGVDA